MKVAMPPLNGASQAEAVPPPPPMAYAAFPSPNTSVPHLRYLDGLRGLTALFVVLHHVFAEVSPMVDGAGLPRKVAFLLHPLAFGHLAVGIFIVLSGFVLMLPIAAREPKTGLGRDGFWGFVLRRARRILPPYYAALVGSLALIAAFSAQIGHIQKVRWDVALPAFLPLVLWTHLFLVHNFSVETLFRINPPFWSIAVEWQIYFVFALLLYPLWKQVGFKGVWPVVIAFGLGPHFLLPKDANGDWFCPWYLTLFTMGMMAACLVFGPQSPANLTRQNPLRKRAAVAAIVCALGVIATTSLGLKWWYANLFLSDLLMGGATTAFLVWAASSSRTAHAGHNKRPLPFLVRVLQGRVPLALGAFSYSLYLVHFPLLSLLHAFLRPHYAPTPAGLTLRLAWLFGAGVPLCLVVAYGFYLCFERPFLSRKNKPRRIRLKPHSVG